MGGGPVGLSAAWLFAEAGVPVTRECFEGMVHGFIALGGAGYGLSRIRNRSSESMNANAGGPGAQV